MEISTRLKNYLKNDKIDFKRKKEFLKSNKLHWSLVYIFNNKPFLENIKALDDCREALFLFAYKEVKDANKFILFKNMFFKVLKEEYFPNISTFLISCFNFKEKEKIKELGIAEKFIENLIGVARTEEQLLELLYMLDIELLKYLNLEDKLDEIYNMIISRKCKLDSYVDYHIRENLASNTLLERAMVSGIPPYQSEPEIYFDKNTLIKNIGIDKFNKLNEFINSHFDEKENLEKLKKEDIEYSKYRKLGNARSLLTNFIHLLSRDEILHYCSVLDIAHFGNNKTTELQYLLEHTPYLQKNATIQFYMKTL